MRPTEDVAARDVAARDVSTRDVPANSARPTGPDLRLVPAAVVSWAAGWWATAQPYGCAAGVAAGCAVVAVVVGLRSHRRGGRRGSGSSRRWAAQVVLVAACVLVVLCSAAVGTALRTAGPFPGWIAQRAVVQVTGTVATDPHAVPPGPWDTPGEGSAASRWVVRVAAEQVGARGVAHRVHAPVVVLGGEGWQRLHVGQPVRLDARSSPTEAGDDVLAMLTALGPPRVLGEGRWWWRVAQTVRTALRASLTGLPEAPAGLLPSLVLGDTSALPPQVEADLQGSGLTHLTAVSGANVAILLGAVAAVAARAGLRLRLRVLSCALTLVAFVVVARPEPSVLRAAVMGAVGLAGLVLARRGRRVPMLAAAVIVLLCLDPYLARSAGFALSVVATGSLLLLAPPWARRLEARLPRPAALALAAPAAAQAACGPVIVLLQPAVSTVAVPANLLADPAVMPATVIGVLAAVVAPFWPGGAHALAAVGCLATWWITQVAARFAHLPGANLPWLPSARPVVAAVVLAGCTAVVVAVTLLVPARATRSTAGAGSLPRPGALPRPGLRRRPAVALALVVLMITVLAVGWWGRSWWLPWLGLRGPAPPADWVVAQCDVGQGDALVVRSGQRRALVIDTGPEPGAVDRCLGDLGVSVVDLVMLSHFHADHVTGLPGVLSGRSVAQVLTGPVARPRPQAQAVADEVARAGVHLTTVTTDIAGTFGADGWQVHWYLAVPPVPTGELQEDAQVNETSLVTFAVVQTPDGARLRLAALGDLEVGGQEWLDSALHGELGRAARTAGALGDDGRVDVVKVAHHGSAKQDPRLYGDLAPRLALIGVGVDNDYGHPARSALSMLTRLGVTVARTDTDHRVAVTAAPSDRPDAPSVLGVRRGRT
ncbi:MAG: ComEC/Rec2 family competence protein [Kineosporiaceae bacterium]